MTIQEDIRQIEKWCEGAMAPEIERVRAFVRSSLAERLERVEADLRKLHAAHNEHRHRTLGDTQIGTSRPETSAAAPSPALERCSACGKYFTVDCVTCQQKLRAPIRLPRDGGSWANVVHDNGRIAPEHLAELLKINGVQLGSDQDARSAVARIAAALGVTIYTNNSDATTLHGLATCAEATAIALRSVGLQDARSWQKIEEWYGTPGLARPGLQVEFCGPFGDEGKPSFFYCSLPGGHSSQGNTRSDALAHAAQWCENELAAKTRISAKLAPIVHDPAALRAVSSGRAAPLDDTCAVCDGRRRDHAGEDHDFVKERGAP